MRQFLFLLAFVVTAPAWAKVEITYPKSGGKLYQFTIESFGQEKLQVNGASFTSVKLEGIDGFEGVHYEVGKPALPVVRMYVFDKPTMTLGKRKTVAVAKPLAPSRPAAEKRPGVEREFVFNAAAYAQDKALPAVDYTVVPAGSVRGMQRYLVTIFPVRYNPVRGELYQMESFAIATDGIRPADLVTGPMLFVVGRNFKDSEALQRYQSFKAELGHEVHTLVYGEDAAGVETLRTAIQQQYRDNGIEDVIIVGDASDVPGKSARHISGTTDHYYRAIDTYDYESDINGPDVGLGRISVSNESQLAAVVEKFIRYQTSSSETWETQISFLGTSDRGFYRVAEGTHNYVIDTWTKENGFVGNFPATRTLGGDKLYAISHNASGSDVADMLAEGRNFVTYSGHGYPGGWAGPSFNSNGIRDLTDTTVMPFVLGFACDTGDYRGNNTFAEVWLHHPAGAIAYWGSMDSSYWDEDDILERRLFDGIFTDKPEIGMALNNALEQLWAHYGGNGLSKYYWESYTTFGDPTVELRRGL